MNILVIEDHGTQRRLADEVLSAAGHRVIVADSAGPALEAIRSEPIDIVLLDLQLPGVDGLALVRQLKTDPVTRAIPVVAMTAYPEEYSRTAALSAGCDAFLAKPISTRTLPDVLTSMVQQRKEPAP